MLDKGVNNRGLTNSLDHLDFLVDKGVGQTFSCLTGEGGLSESIDSLDCAFTIFFRMRAVMSKLIELAEANCLRIDASSANVENERGSETKRWMKEFKVTNL